MRIVLDPIDDAAVNRAVAEVKRTALVLHAAEREADRAMERFEALMAEACARRGVDTSNWPDLRREL